MPPQIWFRGESVNIPRAQAGGMAHDFADGLYFADTLGGAQPFARRAANPADQRVYQVPVDMDAIRVLNLSTDARWTRYMNQPLSPVGAGPTRMQFLTQMPSAEHYQGFFQGFLEANSINLEHYDAVVGPLIQHGGNQMCVLHKGGQPSALAGRLRAQWTPVGPMITTSTPSGALRFGGKLGPGIKTVGGGVLIIVINLFLQWLLGKFMEQVIRSEINRQLADLEPEVQKKLQREKSKVLFILAEGRKPFAEMRFALASTTTPDPIPFNAGSLAGQTPFPVASLSDFQITDRALPKNGVEDGTEMKMEGTYARSTTNYFKTTIEITASDEEVSLFRAYLKELKWYNEQLALGLSVEDVRRLTRDRDVLQAKLDAALKD
jgi:hypothetical protein